MLNNRRRYFRLCPAQIEGLTYAGYIDRPMLGTICFASRSQRRSLLFSRPSAAPCLHVTARPTYTSCVNNAYLGTLRASAGRLVLTFSHAPGPANDLHLLSQTESPRIPAEDDEGQLDDVEDQTLLFFSHCQRPPSRLRMARSSLMFIDARGPSIGMTGFASLSSTPPPSSQLPRPTYALTSTERLGMTPVSNVTNIASVYCASRLVV